MGSATASDPGPLANVMVTPGARDLPGLREFYRRVGWEQVIDDDDVAAFDVHGVVLALFPVARLARDGRGEPEPGNGGIRFTVGIMVDSEGNYFEVAWAGFDNPITSRRIRSSGRRPRAVTGSGADRC
jgi:hypothetical protein